MDHGSHFLSMEVWEHDMNFKWEIIVVYCQADHSCLATFLAELHAKIASATLPVVVGWDFNLLRSAAEKSNSRVDLAEIRWFNDWVADLGLRGLDRVGSLFTWTNRQASPTLSVLDLVFVTPNWELWFPLASRQAITRIGSDHLPLLLSSRDERPLPPPRFRFEAFWLRQLGFVAAVQAHWAWVLLDPHRQMSILDEWHHLSKYSRQFMEGLGANFGRDVRVQKAFLLEEIRSLDLHADTSGISAEEWAHRYNLEDSLMDIYFKEEEYWRQRGSMNWVLFGDANTAYFKAIENGHHRRCSIPLLWKGG
ncbi:uncharacterized protein [Aegilops tauschii subsp. strangulata]|uniref:uncharacterized protein n=1 Tax=Aegilops tauschii subsp. strangulata TaxID=200361 RepID=UPI003CC88724